MKILAWKKLIIYRTFHLYIRVEIESELLAHRKFTTKLKEIEQNRNEAELDRNQYENLLDF